MPAKWLSLKTFEREYIDDECGESNLERVILLAASGDLEVKAGLWVKTHYEEIKGTSLEDCLQKTRRLTGEEKSYALDFYEQNAMDLLHIRIGVGYLTVCKARDSFLIFIDVTERYPLQNVEILPSFWDNAYIDLEAGSIVFIDRNNMQRFVASHISLSRTDITNAFPVKKSQNKKPNRGHPRRYYTDEALRETLSSYFKKNQGKIRVNEQYEHARKLCREGGFRVSRDMTYQVEKDLRKQLLAQSERQ